MFFSRHIHITNNSECRQCKNLPKVLSLKIVLISLNWRNCWQDCERFKDGWWGLSQNTWIVQANNMLCLNCIIADTDWNRKMNTDWNRKMKNLIHREHWFTFVAVRFQLGLAAIWYRIMPHLFSGDDYWKYCWSFWLIAQLLLSREVRQVSVVNKDKNSFNIHFF